MTHTTLNSSTFTCDTCGKQDIQEQHSDEVLGAMWDNARMLYDPPTPWLTLTRHFGHHQKTLHFCSTFCLRACLADDEVFVHRL